MKPRILALVSAVLFLLPASVAGQSRTSVGIGETFTVAATPPASVASLQFYVDGAKSGSPVAAVYAPDGTPTEATATVPGITVAGIHRLEVSAINAFTEGPRAGIAFCVGPLSGCAPPAPSLPRILVTTKQVFEQVPSENGIELRLVATQTDVSEVK